MARHAEARGRRRGGRRCTDLERALSLRPTARAWHDLARARCARSGARPEALDALERAVRLNAELGWGGPRPEAAEAALAEIRALRGSPTSRAWPSGKGRLSCASAVRRTLSPF